MSEFVLHSIIPVGNTLGECILWDDKAQCTWWTDIHESTLYRYHLANAVLERFALPQRLCAFGLMENGSRLVCAFADGFTLYDPVTGSLQWLYRPEAGFTGTRLNDGRVDRQGRFWSGSMVEGKSASDATGQNVKGSLYWISASGCGRALGDIQIANSLCWSLDSRTVYFADSPTREIRAYDFDPLTAAFTNGAVFARTSGAGEPDGSMIDAQGCLWNAQWGGSRIVRYSPAGKILSQLELPVTQPTCVCLGGPNLDLLFVSSARENLSAEELATQPDAGNVFVFHTPYRGLPESRYRL